jgi:hypothetical protein
MHYHQIAAVVFTLILAAGCSDPNIEYGTPIQSGMSIRVMGNTHKRVLYDLRQFEIAPNNTSSFSDYRNCQVKKSSGERLEVSLDSTTNGCYANVLVPFDDEVTLEIVKNGKVVQSQSSTRSGTILTLELGKLPKDRSTWLTDYEMESDHVEFRDHFLDAISNGKPTSIEGHSFTDQDVGVELESFVQQLTERHGKFNNDSSGQWVHVENESATMIQGSLRFGNKTVPLIVGLGDSGWSSVTQINFDQSPKLVDGICIEKAC